jgi:hypothetical protein
MVTRNDEAFHLKNNGHAWIKNHKDKGCNLDVK